MSTRKVNAGIRVSPEMKIEMETLYRTQSYKKTLDKSRRWTKGISFSNFWEGVIAEHLKNENKPSLNDNNPTLKKNNKYDINELYKKVGSDGIIQMYRNGEIDIE